MAEKQAEEGHALSAKPAAALPVAPERRSSGFSRRFGLGTLGFLLLLVTWHLVAVYGFRNPVLLPSPLAVLQAGLQLVADGTLLHDAVTSLQRVTQGFLLGAAAGVTLGVLLGSSDRLASLFFPTLEALRPIPPIAWIPLAILWFGIGDTPSYFIVAVGVFFPAFVSTFTAIGSVDAQFVQAARCMGASRWRIALQVVVPAALPAILTGLRVGLGVGWMAVVAAELVATRSGLGYMIQLNRSLLETARVITGMVSIGMIGFAMAWLLARLQSWLVPWREGWQGRD